MTNIFNVFTNPDEKLEKVYLEAMEDLNKFFQMKWVYSTPKLLLVDSRLTIDNLWEKQTERWVVGWSSERVVYVLNRSAFETDSVHHYSENEYAMLIKHEIAHSFFSVVTGGKSDPKWLWEGVSILASGQVIGKKAPVKFKGFIDNEIKYVYNESGHALLLLVEKYGKEKLIKMLKAYKTYSGSIADLFKENYGLDLNYETFNNLLK